MKITFKGFSIFRGCIDCVKEYQGTLKTADNKSYYLIDDDNNQSPPINTKTLKFVKVTQ